MNVSALLLVLPFLCAPLLCAQETQETSPTPQEETSQKTTKPAWIDDFEHLSDSERETYLKNFRDGELYFAQKHHVECILALNEAEKIFKLNPRLLNLKGACYIELRNINKAMECFEQALALEPTSVAIRFNITETHFISHNYQKTLQGLDELLHPLEKSDNLHVISLLQFKRYICAQKLGNQELANQLESLYQEMDDTPYYYLVRAVKESQNGGNEEKEQEFIRIAFRIYQGTNVLQSFADAMMESGYIKSPVGQTKQDPPASAVTNSLSAPQ